MISTTKVARRIDRCCAVFLNEIESDRISKLCAAADSDERLFWKLLKGQRCSSQMSAFLVDGKMITGKGGIRDM